MKKLGRIFQIGVGQRQRNVQEHDFLCFFFLPQRTANDFLLLECTMLRVNG